MARPTHARTAQKQGCKTTLPFQFDKSTNHHVASGLYHHTLARREIKIASTDHAPCGKTSNRSFSPWQHGTRCCFWICCLELSCRLWGAYCRVTLGKMFCLAGVLEARIGPDLSIDAPWYCFIPLRACFYSSCILLPLCFLSSCAKGYLCISVSAGL